MKLARRWTMRRFMTFVSGIVCGALVGSVVVLLVAPESGKELRERLADRFAGFRDEIKRAYESRMAQMESELEALGQSKSE
jgi:gas vesicle protein